MMQVITCGFIDLKKTRRIRTKINRIKTIKPEKSYWTRIKSDEIVNNGFTHGAAEGTGETVPDFIRVPSAVFRIQIRTK
ncbi:MAG TPA: hypothetical protein DCS42_01420 [Nitrospiraceae bacterium]|nr:hypothetical protein [Nitrospiraceae bacterium]